LFSDLISGLLLSVFEHTWNTWNSTANALSTSQQQNVFTRKCQRPVSARFRIRQAGQLPWPVQLEGFHIFHEKDCKERYQNS